MKGFNLRASSSSLETGVNPRQVIRPVLLTKEVGQVNVGTVGVVVPCDVVEGKRIGVAGYRWTYTQQQSGLFHSGRHLFGL